VEAQPSPALLDHHRKEEANTAMCTVTEYGVARKVEGNPGLLPALAPIPCFEAGFRMPQCKSPGPKAVTV